MANTVLEVKNVLKTFGGLRALDDLNLTVEEGTVHAIIGPNGAGKSTMLNVCIGQLTPDSGTVTYNGEIITGKKPYEITQAGISRVFQTPAIFTDLTILQNVMIPALASREGHFKFNPFSSLQKDTEIEEDAMKYLKEVSLDQNAYDLAGSMSRGNKRRLELAMCLIQRPKLLLLDEPTAGMARHDTNRTIETLQKIKEGGMTKIIIEHDMHVVFSIADRISVLAQGHIIAEGTPDEIRGNVKVQEAYLGGAEL
ncbi:MAG: ABC transporter ATP-binding protein [Motiliproteus sp.]